jgi:nickel-dependent lactate racemase
MMRVAFPFGREHIVTELPDDAVVVYSKIPRGVDKEYAESLVRVSLEHPYAAPGLRKLLAGERKVAVLVTDKTRATPNELLLRVLLEHMHASGVRKEHVEIIVATGLHEPHSASEIEELVGKEIASEYRVYSHNSDDEAALKRLGKTSFGTEVYVNKDVVETDIVVGLGLIEPHFFAGYSGGRKLILPGVAGTRSVYQNHSFKMLAHPRADYGYLEGNPVHEDMVEAAKMLRNFRFIIHVMLDRERRVVDVVAGDPYAAHLEGVRRLESYVKVPVPYEADATIVTNGGYPLDRNLYQAVKGMVTGSRVTKLGGIIILLSECRDGVGHENFRALASMSKDPIKILDYIRVNEPLRDQWEVQKLEQVLVKNKVIVVTRGVKDSVLEEMNLIPASTIDEALETARRLTPLKSVIAIPEGPYVIPYLSRDAS